MKYYKQFYEKGNNSYYITNINDTEFLGIESFIQGKSRFNKIKRMQQGFKLLEISPCISKLLLEVYSSKCIEEDTEFPDMNKYEIPTEEHITKEIKDTFENLRVQELANLESWYEREKANNNEEENKSIEDFYINNKKILEKSLIPDTTILDKEEIVKICPILKQLFKDGYCFLYSEQYTQMYRVVYLYSIDMFGAVTIYQLDIVKDRIKGMQSFILDKNIIGKYYEYVLKKES